MVKFQTSPVTEMLLTSAFRRSLNLYFFLENYCNNDLKCWSNIQGGNEIRDIRADGFRTQPWKSER